MEWPWFCHRWEYFLLIIVSEVGQTYQQNRRKLRAEVFLSATIFCKHFDMVSKSMRYKNARVAFSFPSSLHKVVSSSNHRVESILCIKNCKVLVSWVVKQFFLNISQIRLCFIRAFLSQIVFVSYQWLLLNFIYFVFLLSLS